MFELQGFSLSDMVRCSTGLRHAAAEAASMEEAADAVALYLRSQFVQKSTGELSCPLVRLYKTHSFERLEPDVQDYVRTESPDAARDGVQVLTLLATAGAQPGWNDRSASVLHRAIPLPDVDAIARLPMVAQLMSQLGVDIDLLVRPDARFFTDLDQTTYNVFHIEAAAGSPYVPAQDFVEEHGIRSVLGFGGVLPSGSVFAVIMFATDEIPTETAELFRSIALMVKLVLLPFVEGRAFATEPDEELTVDQRLDLELRRQRSLAQALDQMLIVREEIVATQSLRLEQALENEREHAVALEASQDALQASEARTAAVVNNALDGIISIGADGVVLGWNPAAAAIFGYPADEALGEDMAELIIPEDLRPLHRAGIVRYLETGEGPVLNRRRELQARRKGGGEFPVELTITRVDLPGAVTFTGFVRDITDRKQAEQAIEETRARSIRIAQTLQQSLLPPSLPFIEGVELASRFRPAGDGDELGGDFFDIFQTARDDWGFVLGDVCGKGAPAAALTALVRYTVRATAMRVRKPSAVLGVANEAINRQHPDTFCTAVYGRLRRTARGLRCTFASGGHPLPLVRRASGEIVQEGHHGRLLGPFEEADLRDFNADLRVGDTIVLVTDGVTEARRQGGNEFGEEGVKRVLATAESMSAAALAEAIETAALEHAGGTLKDDLAILVLRRTA